MAGEGPSPAAPGPEKTKIIEVAGRKIVVGGPLPQPREGERLLQRTMSLCPECYRLLPAIIIEREGKVWIRRICPEHGEIEEVYWGDAELYKRAMKYNVETRPIKVHQTPAERPCPFSCGLCPMHLNYTALVNLVATNRCDLSCWYCFFYAERAGFVYEPTLDQIRMMLSKAREQYPYGAVALQITGGEPLLRDDLLEIVKIARDLGYAHIQLNTDGIRLASPNGVELIRRLRRLGDGRIGVNTIYLSFDAVSPINFKNHWEIPFIFENCRRAGMTSIVLVPTVIKGWNSHELGAIIRFAAENIDIVRGVNFQPVSFTGRMPRSERERQRITIPDAIKLIEEQTDGEIPRDAWYPVPTAAIISDFVSAITGRPHIRFANHPACGAATYVYVERKGDQVKLHPITEFIDVDGMLEFMKEWTERLKPKKKAGKLDLLRIGRGLLKFIHCDKLPPELKLHRIIWNVITKHDYSALGGFHYKFLFIGMMHFMDLYNYDVKRVMRCNIHYVTPDGRIVPFCAFNVLSDIYRDYIQEQYKIPLDEWVKLKGPDTIGDAIKYKRDKEKLERSELYKRTYEKFMYLWKR